ncbi:acyl-CoA thioesterase [Anaerobacterium chartisolvens]|uniref:Acyl-CoA thioesterase n=2 Tax=Anaerobacterium chartisolvens TaxID=1297424 RepID=A0A369BBL5_9FIRM|nr:acyl-CoA thioesterase [Anaerobacterium chartisolvens]
MMDFQKYKEYFNKHDMFSVNNGMSLTDMGEGYATVELTIGETSKNYMGSMHGGLLYTMADVAAGTAIVFCGKQAVTLTAHTEYIKPAFSGKVIAEAKMIAFGRTISRCEVEVRSEDGTLYSKSIITMFITDKDIPIIETI